MVQGVEGPWLAMRAAEGLERDAPRQGIGVAPSEATKIMNCYISLKKKINQ